MAEKLRRTSSHVAKSQLNSAAAVAMAKSSARSADPTGHRFFNAEAEKADALATMPLSALEVEGVGAGGDMVLHMPMPAGDVEGLRLRDVTKDPSMVTATAQLDRLRLADDAGALDVAIDAADTIQARNSLEKMLAHQMGALHVLTMRQAALAGQWQEKAQMDGYTSPSHAKQVANVEAARAAASAAKMAQTFQQGLATLHRIRGGGEQRVTVVHQHVQVAGGQVAVAGAITRDGGEDGGE